MVPQMMPKQTFKSTKYGLILENLLSLGLALLIVFAIRSSLVEAFKIPSGSMMPTLLTGDHIFVNKFEYGLRLPFSNWIAYRRPPPQRGDIVVFEYPKDDRIYFIKRVIGAPGDVIEIKNKTVFVNHNRLSQETLSTENSARILNSLDDHHFNPDHLDVLSEHLSEGSGHDLAHSILLDKTNFALDSFGPITVPSDALFVMGDNRDFSNDSRFWGFVPLKNVKGKAMVIWLSLWVNLANHQWIFRPERMGTVLH
jgi:signal peptidase I